MKQILPLLAITSLLSAFSPALADFGDADFPQGMFKDGPKSYHDGFCRKLGNKCRIRFQGPGMWVEGQGGIQSSQYIRYRQEIEGGEWYQYYNYISYKSKNGQEKQALFLFTKGEAQRAFIKDLFRWKRQKALPIPNYRYPNSQGPQDTQGRDKGLNPYDNLPITDWSEKTTTERDEKCESRVYKNRPECR